MTVHNMPFQDTGPAAGLLFDSGNSVFTNQGYTRHAPFELEVRDIDPVTNANLGNTVNWIIPKAADLIGPVDLMIDFNNASDGGSMPANSAWGWVDSVGYAMIEKITFLVGSHEVEVLRGEELNIMNELMTTDRNRKGFKQILKTGQPLVYQPVIGPHAVESTSGANDQDVATLDAMEVATATSWDTYDRVIAYRGANGAAQVKDGKKLCIPLGLFFTAHPSRYFPLAAIAGCNEVRIQIKFRQLNELTMAYAPPAADASGKDALANAQTNAQLETLTFPNSNAFAKCKLRMHYYHVTGPEATTIMNQEHVRLLTQWDGNRATHTKIIAGTETGKFTVPLSFLHSVKELVITIRKTSEMSSSTTTAIDIGTPDQGARAKNYFAYQGGGSDPNPEKRRNDGNGVGSSNSIVTTPTGPANGSILVKNFKLILNGQSQHLDGQGLDREYLINQIMPTLHSNVGEEYKHLKHQTGMSEAYATDQRLRETLSELHDRKEIYVYPLALAPESAGPSGSVDYTKVASSSLEISYEGTSAGVSDEYQVDVYGLHYNWLAIKDGRSLLSFQ
jgi:hypothetical protein